MIVAAKDSPHQDAVVLADAGKGVKWVAPACGCGWHGTPVDPATLGTGAACFTHLRWPYIAHRS